MIEAEFFRPVNTARSGGPTSRIFRLLFNIKSLRVFCKAGIFQFDLANAWSRSNNVVFIFVVNDCSNPSIIWAGPSWIR